MLQENLILILGVVFACFACAGASGAVGFGRFDLGLDCKAALVGAVVDKVDSHAAERLDLIDHIRMYLNIDVIRFERLKIVIRLIQSQSQDGTASSMTSEIDQKNFAPSLIRLEHLADFPTGAV
jgi:hypothetical protein